MNTISPKVTDTPPKGHVWHQNSVNDPPIAVPDHVTFGFGVNLMVDALSAKQRQGLDQIKFGRSVVVQDNVKIRSGVKIGDGAIVGKGAQLQKGSQLKKRCVIGAGTGIGENAIIGTGAVIGENATIGPGVIIGKGVEVRPGTSVPANWYVPGSTTCRVVVNPGKTTKDVPEVLVVPR